MKTANYPRAGRKSGGGISLRLYVAGQLPHSMAAVSNLQRLCADAAFDGSVVEIVDTLREPQRLLDDGLVVAPTLVRISPEPRITIMGALTELEKVREALGLQRTKGQPA